MTEKMPEADAVTSALAAARDAADEAVRTAAAAQPGTALVPTGADAAQAVKTQMAASRAVVVNARKAALDAQAQAKAVIEAKKRELDAQLRALSAELEPLQQQVAMLEEGIWTMNLYLGRDEELHPITEGRPAPSGTPIHVRQQVLAMDEESTLYAEDGGMDVRNLEAFDQWITNPAHLEQVLPEQRGVVAIIPRRQDRDYKDPWLQNAMEKANAQTWWLIRNGENVYRMLTDFHVGHRLVPARDEFTSMFVDPYTKQPLEPGSHDWLKAEKAAGARERHYMRIALILQGLIDRTAVFHPLPVPGLSLLAPEHYDAGHVVLIADDENQLTTGRKPFYEWLAEKNRQLTPGMRVIITTRHQDWPGTSTERWNYGRHERLWPNGTEYPRTGEAYTIARRGDKPGSLVFTYARTAETWIRSEWGREELRVPKTKASCTIFPGDKFVLPVDLVTVEEMRTYREARLERHAYADLVPVLTAAIAFKEAEAAAEAPFRALLAAQVAQAEGTDVADAEAAIAPLIDWWKIGNRWHRPLKGDPAAEARAAKAILAERARIARAAGDGDRDTQVVASIRQAHPDVLLVARRKDGSYVALTPQPRRWALPTDKASNQWRDQITPLDVWVTRREFTATGKPRGVHEWVLPAPAVISRWIALFESEQWAKWNRRAVAADHLTDPEIAAAIDELVTHRTPDGWRAMAVTYDETRTRHSSRTGFTVYAYRPDHATAAPERPLTVRRSVQLVGRYTAAWKRERDGRITLTAHTRHGIATSQDRWTTETPYTERAERDHFGRKRTDGQLTPPWAQDRTAMYVVHVDEHATADAHSQALAEHEIALRAENLAETQWALLRALEAMRIENATAVAKARFVEDYLDESLWADHAKGLRIRVPWRDAARKPYLGVERGLSRLTARLVESGRPPYGLSVAEAVELLGEPLEEHEPGWTQPPVVFPDDVLSLRFPDAPPAAGELAAR